MEDAARSADESASEGYAAEEAHYRVLDEAITEPEPLVLKSGDQFAVFDRWGDILPTDPSGKGLFSCDTRFLSRWELKLFGVRPLLMNSGNRSATTLSTDLTNPDYYQDGEIKLRHNVLHIGRTKFMSGASCFERIRIHNFSLERQRVTLSLRFEADFRDIFEVRGHPRHARGRVQVTRKADRLTFDYVALDGVTSSTIVKFDPSPDHLVDGYALYEIELDPRGAAELVVEVSCDATPRLEEGVPFEALHEREQQSDQSRRNAATEIVSSDVQFESVLRQARSDLYLLTTTTEQGPYPYAGVPWYSTAFGRDGLITALLAGWIDPEISRGVLRFLAATQATEVDAASDAQPGKILHEIRFGEMARMKEVPFARYYGTVDATPLFIVLAASYVRQSGDLQTLQEIWPNLEAANMWLDTFGDPDGDGFVEYQAQTDRGLRNQGWKDSEDSISHADGRLAEGPIALCEVQAYTHLAKVELAGLARLLGQPDKAEALERQAHTLRQRFDEAFWMEDLGAFALALDGDKRPCRVKSSNAGHALFGGLAFENRAVEIERMLLAPEMFCGWGVRTLASDTPRYNPMGYHNGSIWPHDNAMIGLGLARYGLSGSVVKILSALYGASLHMNLNRLPELFCGFRRPSTGQGPTLYPVACSPQAWASASLLGLLKAALGLRFDAQNRTLLLDRPALPDFIREVRFSGLRLGAERLDLTLRQHGGSVSASVSARTGDVDVVVIH